MSADFSTARPFYNKVAWVTGASRGIGRAIATALAQAGAHVVLGARSRDLIEQAAESLRAGGSKADAVTLDVADKASCAAFATEAVERAGMPSILVNNAGIGVFRPIGKFEDDEFERQFRVNVFGMFYMTSLAVPHMRQLGGGHVVNISSLAGESEAPMGCGYFASKHAVNGFTKCLLQDVRDDGIKVTLVCPGSVDTRFHLDAHPRMHERDQDWMVPPEEIAAAVVHALAASGDTVVSRVDVRPRLKGRK